MSWRSVVITQPTKLSIKNRQLQITQDEDFSMPLEDISTIVLETPQISLSSKAMSMMADKKLLCIVVMINIYQMEYLFHLHAIVDN